MFSSGTGTTGSGSTSARGSAPSGFGVGQGLADAGSEMPDAAPCGSRGEPCCLGAACSGGACCVDRTCFGAGVPWCHSLGACTNGSCGACGAAGQRCCDGVPTPSCSSGPECAGCTAANAMCPSAQSGATCVACGGDGQPCCSGRTCAGKYSLCRPSIDTNGTCTSRCGQVGQDCCSNDFSNESSLACRNGAVCLWQTTVRQTTTTGSICVDPSACGYSNGKCATCGVAGTPCCGRQCMRAGRRGDLLSRDGEMPEGHIQGRPLKPVALPPVPLQVHTNPSERLLQPHRKRRTHWPGQESCWRRQ